MSIGNTEQVDEMMNNELGQENHSEHDERAFINQMAEEDGDFNPDGAVEASKKHEPQLSKKEQILSLEEDALFLVGGAEHLAQQAFHPSLVFGEHHTKNLAKATAPLLHKYGGELPPWLKPYKEEFGFVMALAMAGSSMYLQHRTIIRLEADSKRQEQENSPVEVESATD